MTELRVISDEVGSQELAWIAALYGPVDPKYRSQSFLRHQFLDNPFGWSVHVFAIDDGVPVAHTSAIPCRARSGSRELVAAKVEALVVAESHRGRRDDGTNIAVTINERLHEAVHSRGVPVLFALATEQANRVFERAGYRSVRHDAISYVAVTSARKAARGRSWRAAASVAVLSAFHRLLLAAASVPARVVAGFPAVDVRNVSADDVALVLPASTGPWTISGSDAWDWYAGSGLLRVVEVAGRFGSHAVVRLPVDADDRAPAQIVAWQPRRGGIIPALLLLDAVMGAARRTGAGTLRFQPPTFSGSLDRVCRGLGWLTRPIVALELHGDASFDHVALSPFFYVTF
jgi:hypothetical protein